MIITVEKHNNPLKLDEQATVNVNIIRSKRKTATIHVLDNGDVEVRVPLHMNDDDVMTFLEKRKKRILIQSAYMRDIYEKKNHYVLTYGSEILIRGHRVPVLKLSNGDPDVVRLNEGKLYIRGGLSDEQLKSSIMDFLAQYSVEVFKEKLQRYAKIMEVEYNSWDLTDAKKRAASCNSCRKINISWRLIMASDFVIDCVIVHELAHIKHQNHSKEFYSEILKYLPDYPERRKAMSKEYYTLQCEGWL